MIVEPAALIIAAATLGGLVLWHFFFRALIVAALSPKWPSQRRGGA
jgi:hypothetical protein